MGKATKAESRGGMTSKPPKAEPQWITEIVSWGLRIVLKTELPHLAGRGDDNTELQL
jgi:hypothetical protein